MKSPILEDIKTVAKENGWTFERTKKNQWQFFSPDGKHIIVVSGTPSDWRSQRKIYAQFKKAGLLIKGNA